MNSAHAADLCSVPFSDGARRRRWQVLRTAIVCLWLTGMVPQMSRAGTFEGRVNAQVTGKIAAHWKAVLEGETRIDEHGNQVRYHSDFGVVHTGRGDWLDLGLRYRTIFKRTQESSQESDWTRVHRYYLDLVARHRVYDIAFSHRVRIEYDAWEDDFDDYGSLRYRIALNPPYSLHARRERRILKAYRSRFYGSYELSADSDKDGIVRHQFKLGWSSLISETVIGDLYYLWELNDSTLDAEDVNVVGIGFKVLL